MRDDAGDDPARLETIEIKLAEAEFGQEQLDAVVRRQGEDIRRLTEAVRHLGARLEAALGEPASRGGGPGGDPGAAGQDEAAGPEAGAASPTFDPERPPHYSGPA